MHTWEEDGGAFEPVDDGLVVEVVDAPLEGVVVDVDDVGDAPEDGMVVDVVEEVDLPADEDIVVDVEDDIIEDVEEVEDEEDVDESDGGKNGEDGADSVAKTGEMATSPTNPTERATSERRYIGTPISRLPGLPTPGHRQSIQLPKNLIVDQLPHGQHHHTAHQPGQLVLPPGVRSGASCLRHRHDARRDDPQGSD